MRRFIDADKPEGAMPVINHTVKAPKENYLKRHYNKFKAIWNLGQPASKTSAKKAVKETKKIGKK